MSFKTILVHVADDAAGLARINAAGALAERFGARVVGLAAAAQPAPIMAEGASFAAAVWAEQAAAHEAHAQAAAEAFAEAMRRRGIGNESRMIGGFEDTAGAVLAVSARYADLTLIGCREAISSRALADSMIDGALFETGRPAMVVPVKGLAASVGKRVLLAWDGGPQAARAAGDAMPFLSGAEEVRVVVARTYFGMSRHGEEPGADVARWLSAHGVKVAVEVLDAAGRSVAKALADAASDGAADMIVMGGFGHSRLREAIFGGVTSEMVDDPAVPIFISH